MKFRERLELVAFVVGAIVLCSITSLGPSLGWLFATNADLGAFLKVGLPPFAASILFIVGAIVAIHAGDKSETTRRHRVRAIPRQRSKKDDYVVGMKRIKQEHRKRARNKLVSWPSQRAEYLLDLTLSPEAADETIGDLRERFTIRLDRYGSVFLVRLWHWSQAIRIVVRYVAAGLAYDFRKVLEYGLVLGNLIEKLLRLPIVVWALSRATDSRLLSDILAWVRSLSGGR